MWRANNSGCCETGEDNHGLNLKKSKEKVYELTAKKEEILVIVHSIFVTYMHVDINWE